MERLVKKAIFNCEKNMRRKIHQSVCVQIPIGCPVACKKVSQPLVNCCFFGITDTKLLIVNVKWNSYANIETLKMAYVCKLFADAASLECKMLARPIYDWWHFYIIILFLHLFVCLLVFLLLFAASYWWTKLLKLCRSQLLADAWWL